MAKSARIGMSDHELELAELERVPFTSSSAGCKKAVVAL